MKYYTLQYCLKRGNKWQTTYSVTYDSYEKCMITLNKLYRVYDRDLQGLTINIDIFHK